MKVKELYSATISFNEEGVLLVKFKDNVEVGIGEAIELVDVSLELVAGKSFYLLVDARDIASSMDHESRKYIAGHKEYNKLNIAQAIIVNTTQIRLIANFYFKFYGHVNPVKVFTRMDEGRKWLLSKA